MKTKTRHKDTLEGAAYQLDGGDGFRSLGVCANSSKGTHLIRAVSRVSLIPQSSAFKIILKI